MDRGGAQREECYGIYKVERTDDWGYDDYDSFVAVAANEDEARALHPADDEKWPPNMKGFCGWVSPDKIDTLVVTRIGTAAENVTSIVLASFNAG